MSLATADLILRRFGCLSCFLSFISFESMSAILVARLVGVTVYFDVSGLFAFDW